MNYLKIDKLKFFKIKTSGLEKILPQNESQSQRLGENIFKTNIWRRIYICTYKEPFQVNTKKNNPIA